MIFEDAPDKPYHGKAALQWRHDVLERKTTAIQ